MPSHKKMIPGAGGAAFYMPSDRTYAPPERFSAFAGRRGAEAFFRALLRRREHLPLSDAMALRLCGAFRKTEKGGRELGPSALLCYSAQSAFADVPP